MSCIACSSATNYTWPIQGRPWWRTQRSSSPQVEASCAQSLWKAATWASMWPHAWLMAAHGEPTDRTQPGVCPDKRKMWGRDDIGCSIFCIHGPNYWLEWGMASYFRGGVPPPIHSLLGPRSLLVPFFYASGGKKRHAPIPWFHLFTSIANIFGIFGKKKR